MKHYMLDAFKTYRSRMDDILLIYELLEEIPACIGVKSVMPPMVLPYYNGVVPEDCGISAFIFLEGGHFTLHTFSYRECYFMDLFYHKDFDTKKLEQLILTALPAEHHESHYIKRGSSENYDELKKGFSVLNPEVDFGPHLFIDCSNFNGASTMDELFEYFDTLPFKIGMTPIIRPHISKNIVNGEAVISVLTMIAESHISLHYYTKSKKAYFDIFSCMFFDVDSVIKTLENEFQSDCCVEMIVSRGENYFIKRNTSQKQELKSGWWLNNVYPEYLNNKI